MHLPTYIDIYCIYLYISSSSLISILFFKRYNFSMKLTIVFHCCEMYCMPACLLIKTDDNTTIPTVHN